MKQEVSYARGISMRESFDLSNYIFLLTIEKIFALVRVINGSLNECQV